MSCDYDACDGHRVRLWDLLGAIRKRRRPIFHILWRPSLPLSFFIPYGLITPKPPIISGPLKQALRGSPSEETLFMDLGLIAEMSKVPNG